MSWLSVVPTNPDPDDTVAQRVETVRAFNRFYTQRIGVLEDSYLESPFSLVQARVLFELAHRNAPTATEIARDLALDPGYLSRILRGFERAGLLVKTPSPRDNRQRLLALTDRGRDAFAPLDAASRHQTEAVLAGLTPRAQRCLAEAMRAITDVLSSGAIPAAPYLLRPPQPGDLGWVVQRHGSLYAAEYGWDETFEGLVAGIVAEFTRTFDARRERCWIAEKAGDNVGSVFLVSHPERAGVAKLRLLLVDPSARGLGIGRRLVDECTRFARQAGYHTITLWTNSVLVSARRIYEAAGYHLLTENPHHSFGHDLIGQTWEMRVTGCRGLKVSGRTRRQDGKS
jgi:DNA-binding MarR family transcriptional regulator/GNAT superfamily N-acetyltransferase